MACGGGSKAAASLKPFTKIFSSMAFIGLPCPKKRTGITAVFFKI
jgi:hypothetical protein